jgi:nucleotide-binding universal stress UspA family protein
MFTNIIVAIDGSEPSRAAVQLALALAREQRARLTFVHAIELTKIAALVTPAVDPGPAIEAAGAEGRSILEAAEKAATQAGVSAQSEMPEDDAVSSVLDIARRRKADLIILGSHGRSGIPRALIGSVAEGIIRRATIPVLVCHAPRPQAEHGKR